MGREFIRANPFSLDAFVRETRIMISSLLSIRVHSANPNHHLYNNNGTWWVHYTVHGPDFTKRRVRDSLATSDVAVARERRDALIAHLQLQASTLTAACA